MMSSLYQGQHLRPVGTAPVVASRNSGPLVSSSAPTSFATSLQALLPSLFQSSSLVPAHAGQPLQSFPFRAPIAPAPANVKGKGKQVASRSHMLPPNQHPQEVVSISVSMVQLSAKHKLEKIGVSHSLYIPHYVPLKAFLLEIGHCDERCRCPYWLC